MYIVYIYICIDIDISCHMNKERQGKQIPGNEWYQ